MAHLARACGDSGAARVHFGGEEGIVWRSGKGGPEVERVAQVVVWRQVGDYAALRHFVWLWRMNLVPEDPKKECKGMCPCHQV